MYAVLRTYTGQGARELLNLLEERKADVESVIRGVSGFQGYVLFHTDNGGASLTVCQDKAGCEESLRVAREWIQKNASDIKAQPPEVSEGNVILHLG